MKGRHDESTGVCAGRGGGGCGSLGGRRAGSGGGDGAGAGDQSEPTGWTTTGLHAAFVDGNDGVNDLKYTVPGSLGEPTSILDPCEPGALPRLPSLATAETTGDDRSFVAWVDSRNVVGTNGDTDIYFAEGGPHFGTNILVNDDSGVHGQTKPAIGPDATGNPFIVWVDNRNGNDDIFFAGSMEISAPLSTTITAGEDGTVTVQSTEDDDLGVQIPPGALPPGIDANDITIAEVTNLPPLPPGGFGLAFDFGPSGTVFDPNHPVTITMPLAADAPVFSIYNVYRYDAGTGAWTQEGIHNPATRAADGSYLEVQVVHFRTFVSSGVIVSGGGGCALSPWTNAGPVEFILPFAVCVLVLLTCGIVGGLRRRSGGTRE